MRKEKETKSLIEVRELCLQFLIEVVNLIAIIRQLLMGRRINFIFHRGHLM